VSRFGTLWHSGDLEAAYWWPTLSVPCVQYWRYSYSGTDVPVCYSVPCNKDARGEGGVILCILTLAVYGYELSISRSGCVIPVYCKQCNGYVTLTL
jgi:hypothetical protein